MTKKFTTAGAMVAMTAVSGNYFVGLGTGESTTGLVGEASGGGYARRAVSIVATGETGVNAGTVTFATFTTTRSSFTHVGLFTAAMGGTCIWVGPLDKAVTIVSGTPVVLAPGAVSVEIAPVTTSTVASTAPANTAVPTITGTAQIGQALTVSPGTWTGTAPITHAYQWQRGTTNIQGATASSYTVQSADAGATLRVVVTATNSAGTAQATSASTATVPAATAAPSNTAVPTIAGTAQVGQALTASPGTWTGTTPITHAYQWQRGTTSIQGASANTYNVQSADAGATLRVVVTATNSVGTAQATSASTATVPAATAGLTVTTPISPQSPGSPIVVSGTYTGAMNSATLVWRQGTTTVGTPVAVSTISGGTWSHTIATPSAAGTYTLRIAFNGATPTADSSAVTIAAGTASAFADFTFDGTGDSADTVALFGHAFEEGSLRATDPVLLRRGDDNTALRTQMKPLATWPDGTVRTAMFAAELPALANGALLPVTLRKGETHSSPGGTLTWSTQLSGRTIVIKTWAPGNTTTPLWSYDVRAAILANSGDAWHSGPLAISARAKSAVPPSAVQNTAGAAGTITSVRLVVDVTATKDGMLLVDAAFANDAMHKVGGGPARFGWTIEIDGVTVYNQRPSAGAARDLLQYNWWVRRRAKKGTKVYDFHTSHRPLFRPDYDLMVRSDATLHFEQSFISSTTDTEATSVLSAGAAKLTDPYWNWGLNRFQGNTGGAYAIGLDTKFNVYWLIGNNQARDAEILAHIAAEAFTVAGWLRWDDSQGRPLMADEWPTWAPENSGEAAGQPRATARGYPAGQTPQNNSTDHIMADMSHRGDFYTTPAILSGRRMFYDLLAMRGSDAVMGQREASWNGTTFNSFDPHWRYAGTPSHVTGVGWGQVWPGGQERAWAWSFRCLVRASYALPEATPRRDFYPKSVEAFISAAAGALPLVKAIWPDMGFVWLGYGSTGNQNFHANFHHLALAHARRLGLGGPNFGLVDKEFARFRSESLLTTDGFARNQLNGYITYYYDIAAGNPYDNKTPLKTWAAVAAKAENNDIAADWSNCYALVDYFCGRIAGMIYAAYELADLTEKARTRDAIVRARSFRRVGAPPGGRPRTFAADLQNNGYPQIANAMHPKATWKLDTAPVIPAGQSFSIGTQVASGTIIGCVEWTGPIPRNSAQGLAAPVNAWEIVSQPTGNPFTISVGGALKRSSTGTLAAGDQVVQVRCRTYDEDEVARISATVPVTVKGTA